jgi:hypothetical protein
VIAAIIYFIVFAFLIYKHAFFGLLDSRYFSRKQLVYVFTAKVLAVPAFYLIYKWKYGGLEQFDAGLYLKDSKILYDLAFHNTGDFLKLFFGFGEPSPLSDSYTGFLAKTANWDEGVSYRLLFNDNRSIIRLHTLLHFISFHEYFVHALFSCFIGFVGIFWIVKSLADLFPGKELKVLLVFCFLPNTWLFSGALLKEPLMLFNLGAIMLLTNALFLSDTTVAKKTLAVFAIMILIVYLRPQMSAPVFFLYTVFRMLKQFKIRFPVFAYVMVCIVMVLFGALVFDSLKSKSLFAYLNNKQTEFVEVMNGGYFLKDEVKFVYLPHRSDWIRMDSSSGKKTYRINQGAQFHYRLDRDQSIKYFCKSNADTLTAYELIYELVPARSGFRSDTLAGTWRDVLTITRSMAYGLFLPLKADSVIDLVVSAENLLLLFSFVLLLMGIYLRKHKLPLVFLLMLALYFIFLFGFTTPNTGAVVRYRSVVMPFLVTALFYGVKPDNQSDSVSE